MESQKELQLYTVQYEYELFRCLLFESYYIYVSHLHF